MIVSKVVNLDEGADAESTAVQMQCADTKLIDEWFNTAGTRLIDECRKKYGDKSAAVHYIYDTSALMPLQRTLSTGSNAPLREYDRVIIGIDPRH